MICIFFRIPCDREARSAQAQAGALGHRQPGAGGDGGRVAGGGGPPAEPDGDRHRGGVHLRVVPRPRAQPGGCR